MKLFKLVLTLCILLLISASISGCTNKADTIESENELLISAAASMSDVLKEIAEEYKKVNPDIKLIFTFGGSGALQTQIEEGAPVDIFISASQKQMTALKEGNFLVDESIKTLLKNEIVLITPINSQLNITSFNDLSSDQIGLIALGDPAGVPVGQYSNEIFTSLNILDVVKMKAVYGNDVRAVLTWVEAEEVDCGVVYATDAYSSDKVKIAAEAPEGSHSEVTYPVAIIKESKKYQKAKSFLAYLSSDNAANIFMKHGFTIK